MGEYEPNDSRKVTLSNDTVGPEPDRTGPREGEARAEAERKKREQRKDDREEQAATGNAEQVAKGKRG